MNIRNNYFMKELDKWFNNQHVSKILATLLVGLFIFSFGVYGIFQTNTNYPTKNIYYFIALYLALTFVFFGLAMVSFFFFMLKFEFNGTIYNLKFVRYSLLLTCLGLILLCLSPYILYIFSSDKFPLPHIEQVKLFSYSLLLKLLLSLLLSPLILLCVSNFKSNNVPINYQYISWILIIILIICCEYIIGFLYFSRKMFKNINYFSKYYIIHQSWKSITATTNYILISLFTFAIYLFSAPDGSTIFTIFILALSTLLSFTSCLHTIKSIPKFYRSDYINKKVLCGLKEEVLDALYWNHFYYIKHPLDSTYKSRLISKYTVYEVNLSIHSNIITSLFNELTSTNYSYSSQEFHKKLNIFLAHLVIIEIPIFQLKSRKILSSF